MYSSDVAIASPRLRLLLITALVALLLTSQALKNSMVADTEAHGMHSSHAVAEMSGIAADAGDCATGVCCVDSCSQLGLNGSPPPFFHSSFRPLPLEPIVHAASRLAMIYRPPRIPA